MSLKNSDISKLLPHYERWVAEGKPPYSYTFEKDGLKPQWYYDSYHNHILKSDCGKMYSFNIQVNDGPDGDTWVRGHFKVDEFGVKILEQKAYVS